MKNNRGFTIIEVVLVLAIAGLIFLMVFLGVAGASAFSAQSAV
jgi:prepilin-type N-terminal cleavage/methylation domain-containing protein